MDTQTDIQETLVTLTADIVAAHVSNNSVAVSDLPVLISNVHGALAGLGAAAAEPEVKQEPAVSIRSSIKPDFIVCLEDGKKLKMLKRHLMTHYQMTPDQYRAKWNLPADYPMVAPNYAEQRRTLAKKIGLGHQAPQALKPRRIRPNGDGSAGPGAMPRPAFCLRATLAPSRIAVTSALNIRRTMARKIDLEALCHEKGLRITEQRKVIARVLSDAEDHPDVEKVYERASAIDPGISIATVYRTVRLFEEAGILDRHDFGDGRARYEPAPEAHHDHLIDVETGKVIEFVDPELEQLQKQIAERLGFRLVDHRMELYGVALDRKA